MPRKAQTRIKRPSGVEQSANGKYYYWRCNISGLETFADEKRFKEVVANYGSESKLVKEYVLRPAQKYIDAGFTAEYVRDLAKRSGGKKLPRIDAAEKERKKEIKKLKGKRGRKPKLKQFVVAKEVVEQTNAEGVVEEVVQKIYPWTGNPDYFKSTPTVLSVEQTTKDTCLFPNYHLDERCEGCPVFALCQCELKISDEERYDPKHRVHRPKITPIVIDDETT